MMMTMTAMRARSCRTYWIAFWGAMALYLLAMFSSTWILKHGDVGGPARFALALLPVAPLLLAAWAMVGQVAVKDELQQRVHGLALTVATVIVAFGSFSYGLLSANAGLPEISLMWVMPVLIGVYGVATPVVLRLYQ